MNKSQSINKKFYNTNAERWTNKHTNSFWHERQFREFCRYLKKGASVLDIGCASGIHVPLFLGMGRHLRYEGLDVSKGLLKIAQRRYPHLSFLYGDITDPKTLPKKKYDAFWAGAVLQHVRLKEWPQMLANLERLTRRGGTGYITLPMERPNPASNLDRRHFEFFDSRKLRTTIKPHGWKVLRTGSFDDQASHRIWRWYIVRLPK